MLDKAVSSGEIYNLIVTQSLVDEQRWILSAMQKYGQELVAMLWRILGKEQDVCDAYQDTFLRLAHYEGGHKPEHVKAYLFRTANNIAVSMIRRKISERNILTNSRDFKTQADLPVEMIDSQYLQEKLRDCITRLPEYLRNIVILHELAELSYAEIAKILEISAASARVYRCKAIQMLTIWMAKEESL
jgi:RNA polymerase sigma factor (sigma-70 family)